MCETHKYEDGDCELTKPAEVDQTVNLTAEIERLTAERDEAREAARWVHARYTKNVRLIERWRDDTAETIKRWPWLKEGSGEHS